jgi:hypothetical protein
MPQVTESFDTGHESNLGELLGVMYVPTQKLLQRSPTYVSKHVIAIIHASNSFKKAYRLLDEAYPTMRIEGSVVADARESSGTPKSRGLI